MKRNAPEKLDLRSGHIPEARRLELLQLFPEVATEAGQIDFDRLQLALGQIVDVGKERYGMNWPGKSDCFRTIQTPSLGTLRPAKDESVNFETTGNVVIEGDNLEVLKLLQKSYLSKVKMIYIDPPYNTGNDFIYPDNYSESLQTYLEYTGQVDSEGRKFGTNTEADGRFHSKWLKMMYPRLYLARNLLGDDGVIFISIDDAEIENLRRICGEVFGEENLIACLVWEKGRKNDAKLFSVGHEYLMVYAKSLAKLKEAKTVWREEKPGAKEIWAEYVRLRSVHGKEDKKVETALQEWFQALPKNHPSRKWARYKHVDKNGPWRDDNISWPGGDGPRYDVVHPQTGKACRVPERGWVFSKAETMQLRIAQGVVEFREDHTEPPYRKSHIRPLAYELDDAAEADSDEEVMPDDPEDELATQVRGSYFYKQSQVSVKYLRTLMGAKVFDNPKDHEEIKKLIAYVTAGGPPGLVLDFFGGSGTTAEAVLQLNEETGVGHRFIVVQLPEPCSPKEKSGKAALAAGFETIADITKERIRRVLKRQNSASQDGVEHPANGRDRGFRVFKLAESNFKTWDAEAAKSVDVLAKQLDLHIAHIRNGRTADDLLYEILLKSGYPITTPIESLKIAGKTVYGAAEGTFILCLERKVTLELLRGIAELKPERVVCLDEGFANNDQLKANAVQIFKTKGITSFKTV